MDSDLGLQGPREGEQDKNTLHISMEKIARELGFLHTVSTKRRYTLAAKQSTQIQRRLEEKKGVRLTPT